MVLKHRRVLTMETNDQITTNVKSVIKSLSYILQMGTNSLEYTTKYFATHREKIMKRMSEKNMCPLCGSETMRSNLNRHQKTKKMFQCKNERDLKTLIYIVL